MIAAIPQRFPWWSIMALLACAAAFGWPEDTGSAEETEAVPSETLLVGPVADTDHWRESQIRGKIFAECSRNARQILHGWIEHRRDPETHLYSRDGTWDWHNEAADHYSSLVLMAHIVDPQLIDREGTLHQTLLNATRLCETPSGIPATYNLATCEQGPATVGQHSEWLRDGLVRIVEVLGTDNDWYREMVRLVDAILAQADRAGGLPTIARDAESRGNLLQTLARLYVCSGDERYLRAAEQLADEYLTGDPIDTVGDVDFADHGCELVPGLAELFVAESKRQHRKERLTVGQSQNVTPTQRYRRSLQQLLDRILHAGRHPQTGLWYRSVDLRTGRGSGSPPPDTWGYVLFAFENYDRATGENRYRDAIRKPVKWLVDHRAEHACHRDHLWPACSSLDDWSDSYESMIVLWNRDRQLRGVFDWLDWATHQGGHRRHRPDAPYGPGNGGHFDGSTGRTLCLHMLLCSRGVRAVPCPNGLRLGGTQRDDRLYLSVSSEGNYCGRLVFDRPRNEHPTATIDWARINDMPAWFVVRPEREYSVRFDGGEPTMIAGKKLINGIEISISGGQALRIEVRRR
jgi:hypothetical protein